MVKIYHQIMANLHEIELIDKSSPNVLVTSISDSDKSSAINFDLENPVVNLYFNETRKSNYTFAKSVTCVLILLLIRIIIYYFLMIY